MVLLQEGQQLRGRSVVAHLLLCRDPFTQKGRVVAVRVRGGSDLFKLEHCAEELVTKAGTLAPAKGEERNSST